MAAAIQEQLDDGGDVAFHVGGQHVEMHMDGLTPPLELVEAGVWRVNLKLPMAGLWIVNVGFGEEFAEVQFHAP